MRHYCSAVTLSVPSSFLLICAKDTEIPQTPSYSLGSLLYFNLSVREGEAGAYFCLDISR